MKHKFTFGLQVFTTLILFMAIFVTYLERSDDLKKSESEKQEIIQSEVGGKLNIGGLVNRSFTTSLSGIVSCGK